MKKNYLCRFGGVFLFAALLGASPSVRAQSVVFPQAVQAGKAQSAEADDAFLLRNDLLEARFARRGGTLLFDGCEAMNLKPGSELFRIVLGDGTAFNASDMTLESVSLEDLAADASAATGSLRLPGKALKAVFTRGGLTVEWRAVLRDGSHYLRTELDLRSETDQAMESVTPMMYVVDNLAAGSAPVRVGNTRGAVLLSDRIFAGLETPMGVNSVKTANAGYDTFTAKSWKPASFGWEPGDETPAGVLALKVGGSALTAAEVVGARGFVSFRQAGRQTVTFTYTGGSHRLNIVGVDVVDGTGKVVAADYHYGWAGGEHRNNVYTLDIPEAGSYVVRYFIETRTETITSSGNIAYSGKIGTPVVVYDLVPGTQAPARRRAAATADAAAGEALAIESDETCTQAWTTAWWTRVAQNDIPLRIGELGEAYPDVYSHETAVSMSEPGGTLTAEFLYSSGNNRLQIVGVDLVDQSGDVAAYDYHFGYTGTNKEGNVFSLKVPYAGNFSLRYFVSMRNENNTSSGRINLTYAVVDTLHMTAPAETPMEGYWRRKTTLKAGTTWNVSAVVGLVAEGQARRSFLAYSERERAVPWRAMPVYISWYELNINRNNAKDYVGNMTEAQCLDVLRNWKTNFYDVYGKAPKAFVWDDGWDEYGTWKFNPNFPNGFSKIDQSAQSMNTGIGAWLGPVGGYGTSGNYRRSYWANKGGMQLSNDAYYKFFIDACSYMVDQYDFRFFKYDGISAQFSAVGPDDNDTGYNNAEGIISIERAIRERRPDIFFNTTVGTWASPFWFHFTDAVWRQENDYGETGVGTDREKWITYRDRLVYQNFVQNSPVCPINTLMTHGFILSKFGSVSRDMSYDGVVRELRCAFACGSGMVELYNDYSLMNSIKDNNGRAGALWGELAACMDWQERNADVLPDIHWVGGNPWTGSKAEIYGWASWNGRKATLTLRNGATAPQTITTTLRKALDIPAYINTEIVLKSSFDDQKALTGLPLGTPVDIDTELTVTMPASTVFVAEGTDQHPTDFTTAIGSVAVRPAPAGTAVYDLSGRRLAEPRKGVNIIGGRKVMK